MPEIVRVEDGAVGDLAEPRASRAQDVRVRTDEESEVPVPCADLPDRLGAVVVEVVPRAVPGDDRERKEGGQGRPDADGPRSGAAAAMGRAERLVQVEVHDVEVHLPRG